MKTVCATEGFCYILGWFSSVAIDSTVTSHWNKDMRPSHFLSCKKCLFYFVESFHRKQFTKCPNSSHELAVVELLCLFFSIDTCRDRCGHPAWNEEPNCCQRVHSPGIFLWAAGSGVTLPDLSGHLHGNNHWECHYYLCGEKEPSPPKAHVLFPGELVLPGDLLCLSNTAQAFAWVPVPEHDHLILQLHDPVILLHLPYVHWMCHLGPLFGCVPSPALSSHHDAQVVPSAVDSLMGRRLFHLLGQGVFSFTTHVMNHFFCDISPVLSLSCTDTALAETVDFVWALVVLLIPLLIIVFSYCCILSTILCVLQCREGETPFPLVPPIWL